MGASYDNVLQLMSLFPEYSKFKPPLREPAHSYIQESELVIYRDLNLFLICRGGGVRINCLYFRSELGVLVSHRLIHCLVRLRQPIFNFLYFLMYLEHYHTFITIYSIVGCTVYKGLGVLKQVRRNQVGD